MQDTSDLSPYVEDPDVSITSKMVLASGIHLKYCYLMVRNSFHEQFDSTDILTLTGKSRSDELAKVNGSIEDEVAYVNPRRRFASKESKPCHIHDGPCSGAAFSRLP